MEQETLGLGLGGRGSLSSGIEGQLGGVRTDCEAGKAVAPRARSRDEASRARGVRGQPSGEASRGEREPGQRASCGFQSLASA